MNEFYEDVAARLDYLEAVPTEMLFDLVTREGACMWVTASTEGPEWIGDDATDRALAVRICAACPVRDECLELEFCTAGFTTLGVWGALPDIDRRALYPVWLHRREGGEGR